MDISFYIQMKLCGDHSASLAFNGILDMIHGGDQDFAGGNLLEVSDGCLNLGKHGAFLELSCCDQILCFCYGESLQCCLILLTEILINIGN